MQNDFLFNDADPKQCGRGVDAIRKKGSNLKANWKWTRGAGAGMPHTNKRCIGQISEACIGENIRLEAIFWHTYYEAEVIWKDDPIASSDCYDEVPVLLTRVAAQQKAEKMAREFLEGFDKELTAAGL